MIASEIAVLDWDLKCWVHATILNITLWLDEALTLMCLNDEVILTHRRPNASNGLNKLNSLAYTIIAVQVTLHNTLAKANILWLIYCFR